MKKRLALTVLLLFFVWRGDMWAIKLSITLTFVGRELISYIIQKETKKSEEEIKETTNRIMDIFKKWKKQSIAKARGEI